MYEEQKSCDDDSFDKYTGERLLRAGGKRDKGHSKNDTLIDDLLDITGFDSERAEQMKLSRIELAEVVILIFLVS